MDNSKVSILVGRNDEGALYLGNMLRTKGADVMYAHCSPLHIQHEVLSKKPDAVILTSMTTQAAELCSLLKLVEYAPYIVMIADDSDSSKHGDYADLILDCSDSSSYDKLCKRIFGKSRIARRSPKTASFEQRIADALFELCITKNYNGYLFILEAIKLAAESSPISRCISKDIYPEIAARFGVTTCCVERNIRTAIRSSWAKSSTAVKRMYFGPFTLEDDWSPTNSQFIFIVADRLALKSEGHI